MFRCPAHREHALCIDASGLPDHGHHKLLLGSALVAVLAVTRRVVAPNSMNLANLTTFGTRAAGERAGAGQALLGAAQFAIRSIISPLVGVGDKQVRMRGAVMLVCTAGGLLCLELGGRAERRQATGAGAWLPGKTL